MPLSASRRSTSGSNSVSILLCLFAVALTSASLATFMGFHIVEDLHQPPWAMSLYATVATLVSVGANRFCGERIDDGMPIARLVSAANALRLLGVVVLVLPHGFPALLAFAAPLLALGNSATTTLYSFGRLYAEQEGLDTARYNTRLRTMTSLGWMIGPTLAFGAADRWGSAAVFGGSALLCAFTLGLGLACLPSGFRKDAASAKSEASSRPEGEEPNPALWFAAGTCLLFEVSHGLCMAALPLFYVKEAGLPTYAPGLSFAVKCFMEVWVILASANLLRWIGARRCLLLSALLGILAYGVLAQTRSIPHLVLGAALEGLYYGVFAGVSASFVQGFARGRIGRATSLYMNSLFVGGLMASALLGSLASVFDFRAAILSAIGMMAATAVLHLATRALDRRSDLHAAGQA